MEAQNGAVEGLYANGCRFATLTLSKKRSWAIYSTTEKEGTRLNAINFFQRYNTGTVNENMSMHEKKINSATSLNTR